MSARSLPARPLPDRLELAAPGLAAQLARLAGRLPAPARARMLTAAFDRARDAFNRGDIEAVTALFAADVDYGPPPELGGPPRIRGREAVLAFWRDAFARRPGATIENLALEEAAPGRFVRLARLRHPAPAPGGEDLVYVIRQTTELRRGRVVRQINERA